MDKFAIDLDKVLDELELNDDDSDRAHPPSLLKIASCNTFGYNNNYSYIYAYNEQTGAQSSQSSQSSQTLQSHSLSDTPSMCAQTVTVKTKFEDSDHNYDNEKLDTSEDEFALSTKSNDDKQYIIEHNSENSNEDIDKNESKQLINVEKNNTNELNDDNQLIYCLSSLKETATETPKEITCEPPDVVPKLDNVIINYDCDDAPISPNSTDMLCLSSSDDDVDEEEEEDVDEVLNPICSGVNIKSDELYANDNTVANNGSNDEWLKNVNQTIKLNSDTTELSSLESDMSTNNNDSNNNSNNMVSSDLTNFSDITVNIKQNERTDCEQSSNNELNNFIDDNISASNSLVTNSNENTEPELVNSPSDITRPNSLQILLNNNETCIENNVSNNDHNENNFTDNDLSLKNNDINGLELFNGLSEEELMLGKVKPFWIPDNETQMCMHCDVKFTVIKRRHHCRACGKVLCAQCCNYRAKLIYLDNKDARVCQICYSILAKIKEIEMNASDSNQSSPLSSTGNESFNYGNTASNYLQQMKTPDPNNPSEYCSTISPLEQAQDVLNRPPPTVMVPIGVLKRGDARRGEPKQVKFSDGIRPGGDLTETSDSSQYNEFARRTGPIQLKLKSPPVENITSSISFAKSKNSRTVISDANGNLPPILNFHDLTRDKPSILLLIDVMKNKELSPVIFALTKNLRVLTKIINKDCCVQSECWTFATKGLATIGQDEILITFERLPDENVFPRDIFRLFTTIYDNASKGSAFNELSHIFFPDGLFGNKDNSGFIFIRPSLQCFNNLILPSPPFLIGILLHKWEIPWAKVFPLRLVLRLGAEYRHYPCPIISYRYRKPAYCEIGHTIMNVLADFRNFQYTLPIVAGLVIHLEDKKTTVHLPRNRYDKVVKVLNNSNEHVLAFGANFSLKADSHLVCMQNDDGQYQTQAINIEGAARKITGASFIVFSGALKSTTGLTAKMSIVEDGLLVQIPPNSMSDLRNSLKDMKNYIIDCGKINCPPDESIHLLWDEEDKNVNLGVRSPIDGNSLEGVNSVRIYNGTDYTSDKFIIRWTEIFFIQMNEINRRTDSLDPSRLAETTAQSFCLALTSYLEFLHENGLTKIGLRINLDMDKVGYEVGSAGIPLPDTYTTDLDSALIPIIMESIASGAEDVLVMELIFHILIK